MQEESEQHYLSGSFLLTSHVSYWIGLSRYNSSSSNSSSAAARWWWHDPLAQAPAAGVYQHWGTYQPGGLQVMWRRCCWCWDLPSCPLARLNGTLLVHNCIE
jgi:hypothetical protein